MDRRSAVLRSPPSPLRSRWLGSPPTSTQRGSRARTHSHTGLPIVVPMAWSAILGLPARVILTALPDFPELLEGLGQTPPHRRLASPHDGRDLRRRKTLQIAQDQNRPVA